MSEPELYGNIVYKFRKIVGRNDLSAQFRKIIIRYKSDRIQHDCYHPAGTVLPFSSAASNVTPIIGDRVHKCAGS